MSLRWALLLLSVLILTGLTWWEMRRRRLSGGGVPARDVARPPRELPEHDPEPQLLHRAPSVPQDAALEPGESEFEHLPPMRAREPLVTRELPVVEIGSASDRVPLPESLQQTPLPADVPTVNAAPDALPEPVPAGSDDQTPPDRPAAAGEPRVEWPAEDRRRIVALRLLAPPQERFAGRPLRQALAAEGFVLGRFDIFHKPDEEQRAVLSAASLNRPGTFDLQTMDSQHFGGLSLFAVLPGPKPLPQAFEELVATARNLSQRLNGVLQDELGSPLTAARVALLRERLGTESHP